MRKLGRTTVTIGLKQPLQALPSDFDERPMKLSEDGLMLSFTFTGEEGEDDGGVADLVKRLAAKGVDFKTINMNRSSLEDIFVDLVGKRS
jgi:ABC-2 type transport system ATP-binding protein